MYVAGAQRGWGESTNEKGFVLLISCSPSHLNVCMQATSTPLSLVLLHFGFSQDGYLRIVLHGKIKGLDK